MKYQTKIQQFILEHPTSWIEELRALPVAVNIDEDTQLASLKYRADSPMSHPLVQECRGMVVDLVTNEVVAWPYNKFWEVDHPLAEELDWTYVETSEKLDGTLIILYYHNRGECWRFATTGSPVAGGTTAGGTFSELAESCLDIGQINRKLRIPDKHSHTFMFELVSPHNRIVIPYSDTKLLLHGGRDEDGVLLDRLVLETLSTDVFKVPMATQLHLTSKAQVQAITDTLAPFEGEGYVSRDSNGKMVKFKSKAYTDLHRIWNNGKPKLQTIVEAWISGSTAMIEKLYPEATNIICVLGGLSNVADRWVSAYYSFTAMFSGNKRKLVKILGDDPLKPVVLSKINRGHSTVAQWVSVLRKLGY